MDIICNRGLSTEKTCSGFCIPPSPPPPYCEVNTTATIFNSDLFFTQVFPTVKTALENCKSQPLEWIRIHDGMYNEPDLQIKPVLDGSTQPNFLMEPFNPIVDKVILIGTTHQLFPQFKNIQINKIEFWSQNFSELIITTPLGDENFVFGDVQNCTLFDLKFKSMPNSSLEPTGTNTPDVESILDIIVLQASHLNFTNLKLCGSLLYGILLLDNKQNDPDQGALFQLINIVGKSNYGTFIEINGNNKAMIRNCNCTIFCGRITSRDSIFRIINKEVLSNKSKLIVDIDGLNVQVPNDTLGSIQNLELVPSGFGFISGVWIQQPFSISLDVIETFLILNVISINYPVGFRYLLIDNEIIFLSEPSGSDPIAFDSKRGMRETARFNNIEGILFDMKQGTPSTDISLGLINACNDLCIPPNAGTCQVNTNFDPMITSSFGTRRFHTIIDAIVNCTSPLNPLPIELVADPGSLIVDTVHVESIFFNISRDITIFGQFGGVGGIKITLIGRHQFKTGVTGLIQFINLNLSLDPQFILIRTLPLFYQDSYFSTVDYDLSFINLEITTNFQNTQNSSITTSMIHLFCSSGQITIFEIIHIEKGFLSSKNAIIDLLFQTSTPGGFVILNQITIEHSDGLAIHLQNVSKVEINGPSSFSNCAVLPGNETIKACILITMHQPDAIIKTIGENTISRGNQDLPESQSILNGVHFSSLFIEFDPFLLNETGSNSLKSVANITGWIMSNPNLIVGIRLTGIVFTPDYLIQSQSLQRQPIRTMSEDNPEIGTTSFFDIVFNENDQNIDNSPLSNERLFCSDGCPPLDYTIIIITILSVLGISICCCLLVLIACPAVLCKIFVRRKRFIYNPHPNRKKNYTRNVVNAVNKADRFYRREKKRGNSESSRKFID